MGNWGSTEARANPSTAPVPEVHQKEEDEPNLHHEGVADQVTGYPMIIDPTTSLTPKKRGGGRKPRVVSNEYTAAGTSQAAAALDVTLESALSSNRGTPANLTKKTVKNKKKQATKKSPSSLKKKKKKPVKSTIKKLEKNTELTTVANTTTPKKRGRPPKNSKSVSTV